LHRIEKNHKYKLKRAVRELMDDLLSKNGGLSRDQLVKKIAGKKKIFGIGCFAAGRRVDYYWEAYHLNWSPPRAPHAASALLSGVLDLPPDG
jgi:hypothetical protein